MKSVLPTVLITSSLALCALCTFQWWQGARQWERIDRQDRELFDRAKMLQSYTNQVDLLNKQIGTLESGVDQLKGTVKTNEQIILQTRRELNKSEVLRTNLMLELEQYTNAFSVATSKLAVAYENIKQQNDAIKEVIAQRDDYVARLNESIKERNDIVHQYNDLVEQIKKQQAAAAAAQAGSKTGGK